MGRGLLERISRISSSGSGGASIRLLAERKSSSPRIGALSASPLSPLQRGHCLDMPSSPPYHSLTHD